MRISKMIPIGAVVTAAAVAGSLMLTGVGAAAPSSNTRRQVTASTGLTGRYLDIPGYPGEDQDPGYTNQIAVASDNYQINGPATKGTTTTKASFTPLTVDYVYDRSVPLLELAAARGTVLPTATLTEVKNGFVFLVETFSGVKVRSVALSTKDVALKTELSLTYAQEKTTYTPQNTDGSAGTPVTTCWSVALNASC